mmetsp:Transcript_27624/g.82720  ORF Transcript_27624/g.82720 Transcript_27624/m.82720 type:complete len:335 (-) Transcript_27624:78-1082(-)
MVVTDGGILKQWDFTAIGLCDLALGNWSAQFDYPKVSTSQSFTVGRVRSAEPGRRDVGLVSWFHDDHGSVYMVRLDGKPSRTNASMLEPKWMVTLSSGAPDSPSPYIAVLGQVVVVLDGGAPPVLRVFDVGTGAEGWHSSVPVPRGGGRATSSQLVTAWGGSLACVLSRIDLNEGAPGGHGADDINTASDSVGRVNIAVREEANASAPPPPAPDSKPEVTCFDVASQEKLWTVPMHHRFLHPFDGWDDHEFGSVAVATIDGLVMLCLKWVWDADNRYWRTQMTRIRAYGAADGRLLWTVPAPPGTFVAGAEVEGTFFLGHLVGGTKRTIALMRP